VSRDPGGAFAKLMEWQMSGGETKQEGKKERTYDEYEDADDVLEAMVEEGNGDEETMRAKSGDEAAPETVKTKSMEGQK